MYKRVVRRIRKTPDWTSISDMIELYLLLFFQLIGITTDWVGHYMSCGARYIAASRTRRLCVRTVRNGGISQFLRNCIFSIGTFKDMLLENYQRPYL